MSHALPPTRTTDTVDTLFGTRVADPYRWLEDEKSPEVKRWMHAEDAFARAGLAAIPGRDAIGARLREVYYLDSISAPHRRGSASSTAAPTPTGKRRSSTGARVRPARKATWARPARSACCSTRIPGAPTAPTLVRERRGDPREFVGAALSRDGHFLFYVVSHGWNANDVYFQDLREAQKPGAAPARWQTLVEHVGALFNVTAHGDRFYIHTNDGAPRFKVMATDPAHLDRASWKQIVAEDPEAVLDDVSIVGGKLGLMWMRSAAQVRVGRRLCRSGARHQWKALRLGQRLDVQIDVESWPVQVLAMVQLDLQDLGERGVAKPGKHLVGQEVLPPGDPQPDAVTRHVQHLSVGDRSALSRRVQSRHSSR